MFGMVLFGLIWYSIVGLFTYAAGLGVGVWEQVSVSAKDREVGMRFNGQWIWLTCETTVPFRDIEYITVTTSGGEESNVDITLELTYQSDGGDTETVSPSFRVQHVDLIEEAIALACAVGDIAGMRFYQITSRDHMNTTIRLTPDRSAVKEGAVSEEKEIPDVTGDLNFRDDIHAESDPDSDRTDLSFEQPEIDLPPFDPEAFAEQSSVRTPSFEWDPGHRVVIDIPPNPIWYLVLVSLVFGVVGGAFAGFLAGGWIQSVLSEAGFQVSRWTAAFGSGVGCAVFVFLVLSLMNQARKTVINWTTNQLELTIGNRKRNGTPDDVRSVIVNGTRWSGDDDSPPKYECEVYLDLPEGREKILGTWKDTEEDKVYQHAGSFAEDLADALGVEWTWEGFQ